MVIKGRCTYPYIRAYICIYTQTNTHTHRHTCTHTHSHIHTQINHNCAPDNFFILAIPWGMFPVILLSYKYSPWRFFSNSRDRGRDPRKQSSVVCVKCISYLLYFFQANKKFKHFSYIRFLIWSVYMYMYACMHVCMWLLACVITHNQIKSKQNITK